MNWFERYSIPGGYFVALMVAWVSVFYPSITQSLTTEVLAALILVGFLPIGYILSVMAQWVYLKWFGLHRQALRQALDRDQTASIRFRNENEAEAPRDEAIIEARTLLLTVLGSVFAGKVISVHNHQYIRNWIARRMDILALNHSVILASLFGFLIALVILLRDWELCAFLALFIFIILVTLAMVVSILTIRRQITQAIAGIYLVYK